MSDMIGIGVEGQSDRAFWNRFLHRTFQGYRFSVHKMGGRSKLIRETPRLLGAFRSAGYASGVIILDQDESPCVTDLLDQFEEGVRNELRKPLDQRYLYLCVSSRTIESWFLADAEAVKCVLPKTAYGVTGSTDTLGIRRLRELWKEQHGPNAALNKIDFARSIAGCFSVERARPNSMSLDVAWGRLSRAVARA